MSHVFLAEKLRTFSLRKKLARPNEGGLGALNVAQFLGALNDNLFKFLSIYLLIDIQGVSASNDILFFIGVAYVLPFLLFSAAAGVLADRFSKQKIIIYLKAFEVLIVALGFFAFYYKSASGCYLIVFLLSLQSALLSPSKYSIIAELVRKEKIAKANGLITSFTYLAIIMGTFLASFLTQITGKNFLLSLVAGAIAAIVGFAASLYIPYTEPKKSQSKISPFFFAQLFKTFKDCKRTPRLRLVVLASAFFLFIGAFLQLNIIPFAMDFLHLSEVGGGYLFLGCSIGIAVGSVVAGRSCKKELDLGLSCFSILMIAVILFILPLISHMLIPVAVALSALGLFGGMFVVPLESYLQAFSSSEMRGQVVALEGFLSFAGVLLAPICLLLFGSILRVSSATGFILVGVMTVFAFLGITKYLSSHFLHFISKRLLHPFYDLHFIEYPFGIRHQEDKIAILVRKTSPIHLLLLFGECAKFHLFIVRKEKRFIDHFFNLFSGIDVLYSEGEIDPRAIEGKIQGIPSVIKPIFLFTDTQSYNTFLSIRYFETLKEELSYGVKYYKIRNTAHFRHSWKAPLKRAQLTFHFWESSLPAPIKGGDFLLTHHTAPHPAHP
jgi:acyl-[acyl-carrier-protein]-phospholipid O-acyltransferase/long-chain-fatty-acid--[acyl-carrier-protein] ligase